MNHSTNLVRICRNSGLSGSDIQSMVGALRSARRAQEHGMVGGSVGHAPRLLKTAAAFARSFLATLR